MNVSDGKILCRAWFIGEFKLFSGQFPDNPTCAHQLTQVSSSSAGQFRDGRNILRGGGGRYKFKGM